MEYGVSGFIGLSTALAVMCVFGSVTGGAKGSSLSIRLKSKRESVSKHSAKDFQLMVFVFLL